MIRAAFIGIDRYTDPLVSDLNGAVRDATALWAILSDSVPSMTSSLLANENASLASVNSMLDQTLGAAGPDDTVILSFAGHGTPDHRLVVADTQAADLVGTTISMQDLATRFRESKARAVLLLLDCCFSGGATARVLNIGLTPRDPVIPLSEVSGKGRILFAASSPSEPALEDPQTRHGLFTKAVLGCLINSGQPISVVGLVDEVVKLVRADAARFGYEQTPTLFGLVEGEFSIPACRKGDNYRAAFPEYASIKTTGKIEELAAYGLPHEAVVAWAEQFKNGLNPLQIAAVNDHGVLDGNSLLVIAPTSAGKTFVGEVAALKAISDGRKAVFLLPYKALVNEKYEDFSALYGKKLGLRVARCSGDWQDQVADVLRGKYDIAFFTYEKFLSMAVSMPHVLNQIGLVVLDEAQFITEPGRGMVVELLLTGLVSARQRGVAPQLITLSAVIGDTNGFDRWLDCGLLMTTDRPVPLTEGVLDRSGSWSYKDAIGVHTAQFLDRFAIHQRGQKPSSQDILVPLVRHLVQKGEKIIVFRSSRGSTAGCAEYLAKELGFGPAQGVLEALPEGDPSTMSPRLINALHGGVAFHHGDLNRDERVAVERGFRRQDGGIHVLVATSTVAAGINTPASTVIIVETAFPGTQPTPYTVAQFKNMAGRAGRLGFEAEGKAIAIADNGAERNALFRRYVEGRPEAISSSFNENEPGTWVIRLLAQVKDIPRASVVDLIANTYGGFLAGMRDPQWRARMTQTLERLLNRMVADGLIEQEGEKLRLTMLGRACGESPLRLESAMRLVEIVRQTSPADATIENLVVLVESLPERDEDYTPQMRNGEAKWQQEASGRFGFGITRSLRHRAISDKEFYARCKRALVVNDWISGVPTNAIESKYSSNAFVRVGHGDVRGYADGARFLLDSALRIAAIVLERAETPETIEILLKRLDLGLPSEALPLTKLPLALNRGELLAIYRAGHLTEDALKRLSAENWEQLIGRRGRRLYEILNPPAQLEAS
jgi:helicase